MAFTTTTTTAPTSRRKYPRLWRTPRCTRRGSGGYRWCHIYV